MALRVQTKYTLDDYLAAERASVDVKHEYLAGGVYAMTGASYDHNLIVSNLARELGNRLRDRPCVVLTSDMRVRIESGDAATYPDLVALCEPPRFYDERRDVLTNPTLLVEVLSPSTEAYDRGSKFAIYRNLASLREYVLIAQDRFSVEVFTKQPDGRWLLGAVDEPNDAVRLESIQCEVLLRDFYAKVELEAPQA